MTPNYAINPTPEQALRSNRAILPARVIAALDFIRSRPARRLTRFLAIESSREGKIMKLWTCILTVGSRSTITQLNGQDANDALREFVSQKIIERTLGSETTHWSEGAPNRRVFGPEMNEELVGAWDFEITGGDNEAISGLLVETVNQQWEIPEDEI